MPQYEDSYILKNANENTVSDPVRMVSGHQTLFAWGDFDGATVKLQVCPVNPSDPNAFWFDHPDAEFDAPGMVNGAIGGNAWVRGVVEDAGPSADINLLFTTVAQYAIAT